MFYTGNCEWTLNRIIFILYKLTIIYYHRPKRARQIKERQEKLEKERKYYEEKSNLGYDNGVVYDQPPPYEFQTVALNFHHDDKVDSGQDEPSETPVFIDDNKVTEVKKYGRVQMGSDF